MISCGFSSSGTKCSAQAHSTPTGREKSILASTSGCHRIWSGRRRSPSTKPTLSRGPSSAWPWEQATGSLSTYTTRASGAIACAISCTQSWVGQAGAEVEELPDARLAGQEADHAADERPVVADGSRDVGQGRKQLPCGLPVGGEVVLAAQDVVVDPGDVRRRRINAACRPRAASGQPCHHLGIRVMLM